MDKVRWGILSTSNFGIEQSVPAMQRGKYTLVTAIASRDLETAKKAAKRLGIPKYYGTYEQLLSDPEVDAIYNPLPNHLHVGWSIKALEAGKHVLCEKPIGLSSEDGQRLVDAARRYPHLKVMEAFMYRFHPQWQLARKLVMEGQIGELRTIQSFFSYYNDDPNNIRNMADIGGGGLMDIGCYSISLSRFIFNSEPRKVVSLVEYDPNLRTDRLASAIIDFGNGTATFTCSTQIAPFQRVLIQGTQGWIEIEIPFNAPVDRPCKMWHRKGTETKEIKLATVNQYTIQGDLFSQSVLDNSEVPTPIEDSVANMKVIEAIIKSDKTGKWINL